MFSIGEGTGSAWILSTTSGLQVQQKKGPVQPDRHILDDAPDADQVHTIQQELGSSGLYSLEGAKIPGSETYQGNSTCEKRWLVCDGPSRCQILRRYDHETNQEQCHHAQKNVFNS